MPEYLAPGVYIEEVSTGARPIEGVSTSTCGFVGQTERGPRVRFVTSWPDYTRWFGTYVDDISETEQRYLPYAVRGFFENGGQRLFVARITPDGATAARRDLDGGGSLEAIGAGAWGRGIMYRIRPASLAQAGTPTENWIRVTLLYFRGGVLPNPFVDPTVPANAADPNLIQPDSIEDHDNLSIDPTDSNFAQSLINGSSKLVRITIDGRPDDVADFDENVFLSDGGDAGNGEPTVDQYAGDPNAPVDERTGLLALESFTDISILAAPDAVVVDDLADRVLLQCQQLKDRFAIISISEDQQNQFDIGMQRPPQDTSYGAFYMPWVNVTARHTPQGHLYVPATGHIAGIYARVDVERGVHKAPANEVVRGIITRDIGDEKPLRLTLSKQEQDILNPKGVNVIRDFRDMGRDVRVWGARTMSSDSQWKYVPVRRLFIFLEKSIERGTQWVVFEPNYEQTWLAVRTSVEGFLRSVWRGGGLAGVTEEEAFFVKCDRTTMTQDDWDNGRLICLIGVAPVKPAEFVIFRISQKTVESND